MAHRHTWRFRVRTYEIDRFRHVNNTVYLNYLEEAATQASTAVGYPWDWYMQAGKIWIVRQWTVRYRHPAVYGDELEVVTWVSDMRRVRSNREYIMTRVADGQLILRARTDWVFVDQETLQPIRVPQEFYTAFGLTENEPLEDLGVSIPHAEQIPDAHRFESFREVQSYEIDTANHVNNGNYFRWIEHAYNLACTRAGWSLDRQIEQEQFAILAAGHRMEYFKPAMWGDPIKIVSYVTEIGRVRGAWIHEVRHAESDELLARDYAVGVFVDLRSGQPKPTTLPDAFRDAILRG